MIKSVKKKCARFLLRHFLKVVLPEDLLHLKGQDLYFGELKLDEGQRKTIREQAQAFQESFFYKILTKSLYYDACKRIYHNDNDTLPGKMELVALQTMEEVISECRQL